MGFPSQHCLHSSIGPFGCLLPSGIAKLNLNFGKMKTWHFYKGTFLLYLSLSLSSWRIVELQVCLSTNVSLVQREGFCHRAASLFTVCLSDQSCPHQKKIEPSSWIIKSTTGQWGIKILYMEILCWINFSIHFLVSTIHYSLNAISDSSCLRLTCMNKGFLNALVPKVTCGHTGTYSQSL